MANKDIRKGKSKKKPKTPASKDHPIKFSLDGIGYRIYSDPYEAVVYREDIDGSIGVYMAAERRWKGVISGLLPLDVQARAVRIYDI